MPGEVIFDAGPLISACRSAVGNRAVIDLLLPQVSIIVPTAVYQEVIVAGARYPDAAVAQQRVDAGLIMVQAPRPNSDLAAVLGLYNLGKGETEAIALATEKMGQSQAITLTVDDTLAYMVCDRLKVNKVLFLDLLVRLVQEGLMKSEEATDIIQSVSSRYPRSFVAHTLWMLAQR